MILNTVFCENNIDGMKKLDDNYLDLIITSPPYDDLREYSGNNWCFNDFMLLAKEMYSKLKEGGVVVWVVGDSTIKGSETGSSFKQLLYFQSLGFKLFDVIIYEKNGSSFPAKQNGTRYSQIFEYVFVLSKNKMPNFINIKNKEKNKRNDEEYLSLNIEGVINKHNISIYNQILYDNIKTWNNYSERKIFSEIDLFDISFIQDKETKDKLDLSFLFIDNKISSDENILYYDNVINKMVNGGVIVLFGKNEILENNEMSSLSFDVCLKLKDKGFLLHDTMLIEDVNLKYRNNGYIDENVYMFILSKKTKPNKVTLLCDKKNRWRGYSNFGSASSRTKKGSLQERTVKVVKEFSPRNNIWRYSNKENYVTNVWKYNTGKNYSTLDNVAFEHPAIFPEKLVKDLLDTFSQKGDICCDPFSGSGTTFKMCFLNGVLFIGYEISEKYVEVLNKRMLPYISNSKNSS